MLRLLGIDPGLRFTGWGLIEADGNRLRHRADGVISTDAASSVPERLRALHDALAALLAEHCPHEAAIEETFVNKDARATLKLGQARGMALLAPALVGLAIAVAEARSQIVRKTGWVPGMRASVPRPTSRTGSCRQVRPRRPAGRRRE